MILVPGGTDFLFMLLPACEESTAKDSRTFYLGSLLCVIIVTSNFLWSRPDFTGVLLGRAPALAIVPDSSFVLLLVSYTVDGPSPLERLLPIASDRRSSVPCNSYLSMCSTCVS